MRVPLALATLCLAAGALSLSPPAWAQQDPNAPPPGAVTPPPPSMLPPSAAQPGTPPGAPPPGAMMPPPGAMAPGAMAPGAMAPGAMAPGAMAPGGPPHMHGKERFEAANTTHDGRLTQAQAQAAGWRVVAMHFQEMDKDNKGYVTLQDIREWQRARKAARAGGGAPPPGAMPQGAPPPPPAAGQPY